jgi:hypothetical protein
LRMSYSLSILIDTYDKDVRRKRRNTYVS